MPQGTASVGTMGEEPEVAHWRYKLKADRSPAASTLHWVRNDAAACGTTSRQGWSRIDFPPGWVFCRRCLAGGAEGFTTAP